LTKEHNFPTREQLDEAFHFLHEAINKIAVEEEEEERMLKTMGEEEK